MDGSCIWSFFFNKLNDHERNWNGISMNSGGLICISENSSGALNSSYSVIWNLSWGNQDKYRLLHILSESNSSIFSNCIASIITLPLKNEFPRNHPDEPYISRMIKRDKHKTWSAIVFFQNCVCIETFIDCLNAAAASSNFSWLRRKKNPCFCKLLHVVMFVVRVHLPN